MFHATLVFTHVVAAVIALLSGLLAMAFRKGSGWHAAAGTVFFVSMLVMTSCASYAAAFLKPQPLNVVAGLFTFYLVVTGWRAAKNRAGRATSIDVIALIFVLAVAAGAFAVRVAPFGVIALLCAVSDVRLLKRGGVFGSQRIARHLWRMGSALLIVLLSFYPGQAKFFPASAKTPLWFVPHVLVLASLIASRLRYRTAKRTIATNGSEGVAWTA